MDPFVATIVRQSLLIGVGVGVVAFGIFFFMKMAALQDAMLNNVYPAGLQA